MSLILAQQGLLYPSAAGGFTPADLFGASEVGGWYQINDTSTLWADDGSTPASVDGSVYRIDDKSGNGLHLRQATASKRGILRQSGSVYWIDFDGIDDWYDTATASWVTSSGFFSVVACRPTNLSTNRMILSCNGDYYGTQIFTTGAARVRTQRSASSDTDDSATSLISAATDCTITEVGQLTQIEAWVDGSSNGATSHTSGLDTGSVYGRVGAYGPSGIQPYLGRYYGHVSIDRAPTGSERTDLETYMEGLY